MGSSWWRSALMCTGGGTRCDAKKPHADSTPPGYPLVLALAAAFTTLSAPLYSQPEARYHIAHILQRTLLLSLLAAVLTGE